MRARQDKYDETGTRIPGAIRAMRVMIGIMRRRRRTDFAQGPPSVSNASRYPFSVMIAGEFWHTRLRNGACASARQKET